MRLPHFAPVDPATHWLVVALVVASGVALAPPVQRWLYGSLLHAQGVVDALVMRGRPTGLVADVVDRKSAFLHARAEATIKRWEHAWRTQSLRITRRYRQARVRYEAARETLAAAMLRERTSPFTRIDNDRLHPIGFGTWLPVTILLAIGDVGFTFVAFELWDFPIYLLLPMAVLFGILGVILGHLSGHALYARERLRAGAIVAVAAFYALVLGSMRYAYMSRLDASASFGNVVSSYGVIVVLVAVSAILGSQYDYRSPVRRATAAERRAKLRLDRLDSRGFAATTALRARIAERQSETIALGEAYRRGFDLGWTSVPLATTDRTFVAPTDIRWPVPIPSLAGDPSHVDDSSRIADASRDDSLVLAAQG